jgi:hypothetical protein
MKIQPTMNFFPFLVLSLLIIGFTSLGQIEIVDLSKNMVNKTIKYDSTFFLPKVFSENESILNGIKGQNLIFLSAPYGAALLKNGEKKNIYTDEFNKYINKALKISEIIESEILIVENSDSILYKPSFTDVVFIESGYNKFLKNNLGKKYYIVNKGVNITPFEGRPITFKPGKVIFLKKVQLAKLSEINDFAFLYTFHYDGEEFKFKKDYNFFDVFSSGINGLDRFSYGESFQSVDFMDENLFKKIEKSIFKNNIYNSKISVGMSELEVNLAWGIPSKARSSSGYDKVLLYEQGDSSYIGVYFKKGKAVKILK